MDPGCLRHADLAEEIRIIRIKEKVKENQRISRGGTWRETKRKSP